MLLAVLVVAAGVLLGPKPSVLSSDVRGDADLADRVRPLLKGPHDQLAVVLIEDGRARFAGFGVDESTEFEIGSLTKTFTSHLLADAVRRGEVTLDTKVGDLVPAAGSASADVTLAELASHRSGLPRLGGAVDPLAAVLNGNPYTATPQQVVDAALAAPLSRRGTVQYSNLGAALLGELLARRAGVSYQQLLTERMLRPLGMDASYLPLSASELRPGAPAGRNASGDGVEPWTLNGDAPAGGIRSTASDLTRYAQALLDGGAPGMDALEPRWDAGDGERIGLAWFTRDRAGKPALTFHNGRTGGYSSMLALDRAGKRAAIVLSNTMNGSEVQTAFALLEER